jgi:hypothetical protein
VLQSSGGVGPMVSGRGACRDLSMPRVNGEDVGRWVHAHPDRAEGLRTVVVTAWGGERRGPLQELGIRTVLAKPFRLRHLTDLIAGLASEVAAGERPERDCALNGIPLPARASMTGDSSLLSMKRRQNLDDRWRS